MSEQQQAETGSHQARMLAQIGHENTPLRVPGERPTQLVGELLEFGAFHLDWQRLQGHYAMPRETKRKGYGEVTAAERLAHDYWDNLRLRLTPNEWKIAVDRAIYDRKSSRLPSPAEFVEFATGERMKRDTDEPDAWAGCWIYRCHECGHRYVQTSPTPEPPLYCQRCAETRYEEVF